MAADTTHESFSQPENDEVSVWRYMDIAKLISMLSTKSLYYSRIDKVGDAHEGCITKKMYEECCERENNLKEKGVAVVGRYGSSTEFVRQISYVNCWCMHDSESDALWRLYGSTHGGIALRTTYKKLADALPSTDHIGLVKYLEYENEKFDRLNAMNHIMHKRNVFEYEHEVRVVRWFNPPLPDATNEILMIWNSSVHVLDENMQIVGINVPVSIKEIIQEIVVSPYGPAWYTDCVTSMVKAYGVDVPVRMSSMSSVPLVDFHPLTDKTKRAMQGLQHTGESPKSVDDILVKPVGGEIERRQLNAKG